MKSTKDNVTVLMGSLIHITLGAFAIRYVLAELFQYHIYYWTAWLCLWLTSFFRSGGEK